MKITERENNLPSYRSGEIKEQRWKFKAVKPTVLFFQVSLLSTKSSILFCIDLLTGKIPFRE